MLNLIDAISNNDSIKECNCLYIKFFVNLFPFCKIETDLSYFLSWDCDPFDIIALTDVANITICNVTPLI